MMNKSFRFRQFKSYMGCSRRIFSQKNTVEEAGKPREPKIAKTLQLDPKVASEVDDGLYHPKRHPGRVLGCVDEVPESLSRAMEIIAEGRKKSDLVAEGKTLCVQLWGRHLPPEQKDYIRHIKLEKERTQILLSDLGVVDKLDVQKLEEIEEKIVTERLKKKIHPWHPLSVTAETCLQYFLSRTPAEFCILHKIFTELRQKDPEFSPKTVFDLGSGVASGYWAVSEVWQQPLKEVFNVETNLNMINLARRILQLCGKNDIAEKGMFFRQFFPVSFERTYDITLSAFTLLELPSFKERMEAISQLWSKTEKYLVIVEDGTNAGYEAVMEARNLLIHLEMSDDDVNKRGAHLVAPCPHDFLCPRFIKVRTPCNFQISYLPPKFLMGKQVRMTHMYSYAVIKKGPRPSNDPLWPRCVRNTLKHTKELHFRLCTSEGKLEDVSLRKKDNCRNAYKCAKHTSWGDCLPGQIEYCDVEQLKDASMRGGEENS